MSIDYTTDPIFELYQSICPDEMSGFSAKHLYQYIERNICIADLNSSSSKASFLSLGKNIKNAIHIQAISLFLYTLLDQDKDGLVGYKDMNICRQKFLFWMSPVGDSESLATKQEYNESGRERFRHISLMCGSYQEISLAALESICIQKLPMYVPSRTIMARFAALFLISILSSEKHIPLSNRSITQEDWLTGIQSIYNSLQNLRDQEQIERTKHYLSSDR